jgi:hypothetical protein
VHVTEIAEGLDDLPDQAVGRGGARRQADGADAVEPREPDVVRVVDQLCPRPRATSRFELDEVSEPTTSTRSESCATSRSACWRLWVA